MSKCSVSASKDTASSYTRVTNAPNTKHRRIPKNKAEMKLLFINKNNRLVHRAIPPKRDK